MNNRQAKTLKKYTSHFICNVCVWEGVEDRTEQQYIDPHSYGRQHCVFLVLQGCSTGGPGVQFSAECSLFLSHLITNWSGPQTPSGVPRATSAGCGFPYHILSPTSLIPNSSGAPRAPSNGLSLPHLISNFSGPQLSDFLSWPLNRLLNLWNGMFDRHHAEITVMQFTGHSLPVHQSMSVPWEFLPCPISSTKPAYAISPHNCQCITLEWQVWPGRRSKYNNWRKQHLRNMVGGQIVVIWSRNFGT